MLQSDEFDALRVDGGEFDAGRCSPQSGVRCLAYVIVGRETRGKDCGPSSSEPRAGSSSMSISIFIYLLPRWEPLDRATS